MAKKEKFILLSLIEFQNWLNQQQFTRKIKLIQNHHTYVPDYSTFSKSKDHFSITKSMEKYHKEVRKFSEIAQNITTFPDGKIMICRNLNIAPAGIKGANSKGICIEHLGNFDKNGDEMTDDHKVSIIGINALLCKKFDIDLSDENIVYHYWYDLNSGKRMNGNGTTKSCPGTNFFGGNSVKSFNDNLLPLIRTYKKIFDQLPFITFDDVKALPLQIIQKGEE